MCVIECRNFTKGYRQLITECVAKFASITKPIWFAFILRFSRESFSDQFRHNWLSFLIDNLISAMWRNL